MASRSAITVVWYYNCTAVLSDFNSCTNSGAYLQILRLITINETLWPAIEFEAQRVIRSRVIALAD